MATADAGKTRLKGLYAITDEKLIAESEFFYAVEFALSGGASIIQYRDKSGDQTKRLQQAKIVCSLCETFQATSIINDDIELAKAVNADGVHLGKGDASIGQAREALGKNSIIGISCYDDLQQAIRAEESGADYVAFGAMYASSTKPDAAAAGPELISKAKQQLKIPVCAIGGITENNIQQLIHNGTDMAAVIHSLFSSHDIKQTATKLSLYF